MIVPLSESLPNGFVLDCFAVAQKSYVSRTGKSMNALEWMGLVSQILELK
jgi:hypothetical protein